MERKSERKRKVKVYLLYNVAENNETSLEAIVTDKAIADTWAAHWGNHYDEWELDKLNEIAWAIKGQPNSTLKGNP